MAYEGEYSANGSLLDDALAALAADGMTEEVFE